MREDLEDEEHDEKVRKGDLREDTRVLRDWMPCPQPDLCDFACGRCRVCGKRDGLHGETMQLTMLAKALDGGMPLQADELPFGAWIALGALRKRGMLG